MESWNRYWTSPSPVRHMITTFLDKDIFSTKLLSLLQLMFEFNSSWNGITCISAIVYYLKPIIVLQDKKIQVKL